MWFYIKYNLIGKQTYNYFQMYNMYVSVKTEIETLYIQYY
jgi:hypothetical protein